MPHVGGGEPAEPHRGNGKRAMTVHAAEPWTDMFLADQVAIAVTHNGKVQARFGTLASHPYNQGNPDLTIWWLFRRRKERGFGNWPAYSRGKYFFDRPAGRGILRAGLHIEKGVAPEHARAYGAGKGQFFGMTPEWAWYGFVEDLRS